MQQEIAPFLKLDWLLMRLTLPQLDKPLAFRLVPVASYDLGAERHVLPEVEHTADLVQIVPDVGRV